MEMVEKVSVRYKSTYKTKDKHIQPERVVSQLIDTVRKHIIRVPTSLGSRHIAASVAHQVYNPKVSTACHFPRKALHAVSKQATIVLSRGPLAAKVRTMCDRGVASSLEVAVLCVLDANKYMTMAVLITD